MAYNLTTLKTALQSLLVPRVTIALHKSVNDQLLDYLYIPFGIPFPCLSATIPDNCHKCDGALLNIVDNPYLFDAIGTLYLTHGTLGGYTNGDGITTFNLPFIAAGASLIQSGSGFTLGLSGGSSTTLLTAANIPSVTVPLPVGRWGTDDNNFANQFKFAAADKGSTATDEPGFNFSLSTSSTGGSTPVNNMPPYIVVNWIIRLK